ncbi:uncharacterized protein LOC135683945 isoform X1 [Rhopilema esculentum]|uniref:uncharacterized protein LOC135683945 isoform X1 n=1 Tax=Rhopilema esculentum TaxID=499914 RepID=UPI0031DDA4D7
MLIFLAIVALGTTAVIQAAGKTKTYPGFTVFDKDGEYLKLAGPLYAHVKPHLDKFPPYSFKSKFSVQAVIIPTVDIVSLFLNGTVFFEEMPIKYFDDYVDTCLYHSANCPYLKAESFNRSMEVKFMDTGLIPGWYEGDINASTMINGKRLRLGGFKFKLKLRDDS